jgi:hypothetical protein
MAIRENEPLTGSFPSDNCIGFASRTHLIISSMTLSAKLKVKISVYGESDFAELWLLPSNKPDSGMVREGISIVVSLQIVGCGWCLLSSFSSSLSQSDY